MDNGLIQAFGFLKFCCLGVIKQDRILMKTFAWCENQLFSHNHFGFFQIVTMFLFIKLFYAAASCLIHLNL